MRANVMFAISFSRSVKEHVSIRKCTRAQFTHTITVRRRKNPIPLAHFRIFAVIFFYFGSLSFCYCCRSLFPFVNFRCAMSICRLYYTYVHVPMQIMRIFVHFFFLPFTNTLTKQSIMQRWRKMFDE